MVRTIDSPRQKALRDFLVEKRRETGLSQGIATDAAGLGDARPPHDRNHATEPTEFIMQQLNPSSLRQFSRKDLLALYRELNFAARP
jgi:hypothetical protein